MSQVTKRTGEAILFEWDAPSNPALLDEFRLESSNDGVTYGVVQGGISPNATSISKTADAHKFYRLAAVKGSLAAYADDIVEVIIDDTPPKPVNFRAS